MSEDAEISNKILELTRKKSPETVEKLIEIASHELDIPRDIALTQVIELENQGRLTLSSLTESIPKELNAYLFSIHASWFWVIIALSTATAISVFTIHEKAVPYIYIRYILGSIFVLLLPGYSLIKTLFPTKEIDNIERTALSIGMSLALVPLVGLLLNYTPWGIRLTPVTLSLLSLTIILTIIGLLREHNEKTRNLNE
jgi:uncharacterized membrane protein